MSETPPHTARPLGDRDRTPELTTKREKRHRDDDLDERDRKSHRHRDDRSERDRDRDYGRERERRDRDHYDRDSERDRDRDRERERERERRHRYEEEETEEEREERRRRRRERERERERDPEDRHRSERDDDRHKEHRRDRDRDDHRDRDRERERERRSSREYVPDERNGHRERSRSRPRIRDMTREEKERERERRDREMMEERRELARREGRAPSRDHRYRSKSREASQLLDEVDAEARSVFVSQIAARLTNTDLGAFFEDMLGPRSVRDARIITDKGRRSKGMGYVTLASPELVNKALNLTGKIVMGIPIVVGLTPADSFEGQSLKAVIASLRSTREAQREQRAADRPRGRRFPPVSPGTILLDGSEINGHAGAAIPYHRLYITNLADSLGPNDVRDMFETFGELEFVDLHLDPRGNSKGEAYVQFVELASAQLALDSMNGFELAGNKIKVEIVEARADNRDVIEDHGRGGRLNAEGRMALMQKLARTDRSEGSASAINAAKAHKPEAMRPTLFVVVNNMFDPDEETERNWDLDLAEDVKGEVENKYGRVAKIKVDKMSKGDVYIEFSGIDGAERAVKGLSGRFFGGRTLGAQYISETLFKAHL